MSTPKTSIHAGAAGHELWFQENMKVLRASGLRFEERPTALLFREPGKPRVDFFPHTGRWRVVGQGPDRKHRQRDRGEDGRTFRGGAKSFLAWYAKQIGPSAPPVERRGFADGADDETAAEIERLRAEVARLRLYEPQLKSMEFEGNEVRITGRAPIARDLALHLAAMLLEHNAPNYIETRVTHPTKGDFAVTVQRCAGKSPHQFRLEAEAARDAALADAVGWKKGVEDANRLSQGYLERADRLEAELKQLREERS